MPTSRPEAFVAARNALVKRLKAEGDSAAAAAVKELRKPTVAQWVTAQVRRHSGEQVDALRDAVREVATAQESAITSGDRDVLRSASARRRDAVEALRAVVDDVLARNSRPANLRDDVVSALESEVMAEVASGTFGLRDDFQVPALPEKPAGRDEVAERRAAAARAAIEAAEERVERARHELERAESALAALRAAHDDA